MPAPQPRYPITPLADTLGITLHQPGNPGPQPAGLTALANATHIEPRNLRRRYLTQGLTPHLADRAATHAGHHPTQIWPTWATDLTSEEEADDWFTEDPTYFT